MPHLAVHPACILQYLLCCSKTIPAPMAKGGIFRRSTACYHSLEKILLERHLLLDHIRRMLSVRDNHTDSTDFQHIALCHSAVIPLEHPSETSYSRCCLTTSGPVSMILGQIGLPVVCIKLCYLSLQWQT